jgi:LuxR family maltose regulon positive regulatory protein
VVERAGAAGHALEILVLQALALQARGNEEQALTALARALDLGRAQGYVRTFVDEGRPMGHLLGQAVRRGIAVEYAATLLAALEGEGREAVSPPASPLMSLSPRELEVLRLLTTPLSHAEMADMLVVSLNTVRSHVKSIYAKLDVHGRMEAVARATELGLLD